MDAEGNFLASGDEGTRDEVKTAGDWPVGVNANRLEDAPIRYPQEADSAGDPIPTSDRATRELTMVVANTAAPILHWGRGVTAVLNGGAAAPD